MQKHPNRKNIRLPNYDYSRNGAYYITICTYMRQQLFGKIAQAADPTQNAVLVPYHHHPEEMLLYWLSQLECKYIGVKVDYHLVMPDHIHLILLKDGDTSDTIPEIVQWYKTQTTNEYIRKVKTGYYPPFQKLIWQRGYFERVIRNENELTQKRKYISENPARWAARCEE